MSKDKIVTYDNELLYQLKDSILVILVLLDLIFILIITFDYSYNDLVFYAVFDLIVCFLLFLNLINEYKKSNESIQTFIKGHIIDILSMIPYNFIFLRYLAVLRIIRILQVLQLFKIFNLRQFQGSLKYFVHNQLLKTLSLIMLAYMFLSAYILLKIDSGFHTMFDALWYNIVTISSVGYGDITPVTYQGKLIGIFTIILGVLFISIFTAAMSGHYMQKPEQETRKALEKSYEEARQENIKLSEKINNLEENFENLNEKIDHLTDIIKEDKK